MSSTLVVGDLLEASGLTTVLAEAEVASAGVAGSFLKVEHLTQTRHAHQVTALALAKLQKDAYDLMGQNEEDYEKWKAELSKQSPTFMFWDQILHLEILVLIFVRAHRQKDFALYVATKEAPVPWFFTLDQTNYAQWLPVHLHDLRALPDITSEELHKYWVFPKSTNIFSSMPTDQAHEENNGPVKGRGGAIGLMDNPAALTRWMVAGPEQARHLQEFEVLYQPADIHTSSPGHKQGLATNAAFMAQVTHLCESISALGNPFLEES